MLLDEYVDFRVRVGESERLRVEREQARRAREHGRWMKSLLRRRAAVAEGEASVPAEAAPSAAAPAAEGAPEPVGAPARELAHAGR